MSCSSSSYPVVSLAEVKIKESKNLWNLKYSEYLSALLNLSENVSLEQTTYLNNHLIKFNTMVYIYRLTIFYFILFLL